MPDADGKTPMEAGSPEFAEDRTQINSLNNKFLFDGYFNLALTGSQRGQTAFDNLQQLALTALKQSVDLQAQLSARTLKSMDNAEVEYGFQRNQRSRHLDMWAYEQAYDLGNPVATGAGDTLRSAAYTPNRATDVAAASTGVAAAGTATIDLAVLQQAIQALTTAATTIANVVNQAQPKTGA